MLTSPWPDLDDIVEVDESHIVGTRCTTAGEDFYEHHFPRRPVVPAVLLLSWLEHAAALWVGHVSSGRFLGVLVALERMTCVRVVTPGDHVRLAVRPAGQRVDAQSLASGARLPMTALVERDGTRILRAEFVLEIVAADRSHLDWTDVARTFRLGDHAAEGRP